MDGNQFDTVLRRAAGDGSRRGILRAGTAAVAAFTLGRLGLSIGQDAEAKKKKKKKKHHPQTCSGDRPNVCGNGCCSNDFPKCCDDAIDVSGKQCAPSTATCCPLSQGGSWCGTGFACCPLTTDFPAGHCCPTGVTCCASNTDCPIAHPTCGPDGCCGP